MDYNKLNEELFSYILMLNKYFQENHISLHDSKSQHAIESTDNKCSFILDIHKGGAYSRRIVFNLRLKRSDETIFRLEIDGKPHVNHDGTCTDRNHVHIIKFDEGKIFEYGISLNDFHDIIIKNTDDICEIFENFCTYNKIKIPQYQKIM